MTNKARRLLCVCGIILVLVGCRLHFGTYPRWYGGDHMDLYTIAAFSIVGVDDLDVTPEINVLESDDYGRTLYSVKFRNPSFYSFYSNDTFEHMCAEAFIICQKSDNKNVFYYEDICYRVCEYNSELSLIQMNSLKEQNDWNRPLNDTKMTSRNIIKPYDDKRRAMSLDYDTAFHIGLYKKTIFSSKISEFPENRLNATYLDCNMEGKSLIVVWILETKEDDINISQEKTNLNAYFMMLEPNYIQTKTGIIKNINDPDHYWNELLDFKIENGWMPV